MGISVSESLHRNKRVPRWLACLAVLAASLPGSSGAQAEPTPLDPWKLWNEIYEARATQTIHSAQLSYLRQLYTVSSSTGAEEYFPIALESYTVQGDHYLVESTRYESAEKVSLEGVDIASLVPSETSTYFWNGENLVVFRDVPGSEPIVSISDSPARVPDFASFGRAPGRMPSAKDWDSALKLMGKKLTVKRQATNGEEILILRAGSESDSGYYLDLQVDPARDNAIIASTTKLGGVVVIEEEYRGFSEYDGFYVPHEVIRKNFRIDPSRTSSTLSSKEEFRLVGNAKFNGEITPSELTRPIPEGSEKFEKPERDPAQSGGGG